MIGSQSYFRSVYVHCPSVEYLQDNVHEAFQYYDEPRAIHAEGGSTHHGEPEVVPNLETVNSFSQGREVQLTPGSAQT